MSKVSVIIAVFNAEQWIEKCVHSLFSQTLDEIEFIFVDDCSNDKSISIIKHVLCSSYSGRIKQVHFISHTSNLGVAAARTTGMKAATGEYMIHCDPDDWVEPNIYELLYNKAKDSNSDIVICDFICETFNGHQKIEKTPRIYNPHDFINCLTNYNVTWSLWNKLIKTSIIKDNEIYPFENIVFTEDLNVVIRCMYYANKIDFVNKALYHYNISNSTSICNSLAFDNRKTQQVECINRLEDFFGIKQEDFKSFFIGYKLQIKNGYLIPKYRDFNKWRSICPELKKDIFSVEKYKFFLRFCFFMLACNIDWPYKLYIFLSKTKNKCRKFQ